MTMLPLKAHVKNGRLVLDEPTDLPEGDVIELVPLGEVLAAGALAAKRYVAAYREHPESSADVAAARRTSRRVLAHVAWDDG